MADKKPVPLFLIVNPKSGGNKGAKFLKAPQPLIVDLDVGGQADLRIFSMLDGESGDKPGFRALKEALKTHSPIRLFVGGGDGTVMWADSEATKHGIDTSTQVLFGIVPLGTGNDFSRVAGWGGRNPSGFLAQNCRGLRHMVQHWMRARPRPHDVWEVSLSVDESSGDILTVSSDKEEKSTMSTFHSATMINYFSIGQESKVGIEFDKHRTRSQTCNLFVYAWEGIVTELQCCSQQHIGNIVASLHVGTDENGETILDCMGDKQLPQLKGNPESLMFLNVNSYAGGNAHFWSQKARYATHPRPKAASVDVRENPGDGRLEVVTLPNIVDIPIDTAAKRAKRLHSGGPYFLSFLACDEDDVLEAYCEVDGEYFHLLNPESVSVTLKKKLQVLQRNDEDDSDTDEEGNLFAFSFGG